MQSNKVCQALVFLVLGFLEFLTIEFFLDHNILDMEVELIFKNVLLYWFVNLILVSLFHRMRPAMLVSVVLVLLLGITNYLVCTFRGYGIVFLDLYAIRTVATVAGQYSMQWRPCFVAGMAVGFLCLVLCMLLPAKQGKYFQKRTMFASACGLAASLLFFFWVNTSSVFFRDISDLTWDHKIGIHDYGYAMYFVANMGSVKVSQPEGYSWERAETILARYRMNDREDGQGRVGAIHIETEKKTPNLILIMNESFSDLRVLGENFHSNQNAIPFYDSLTKNTIKGYAEASVYGGYTANSEFEFLTGCTKAFLPGNPYLQYITEELPSFITTVKEQEGYQDAVAMHPYHPSGYNRNRIYPLLSFDRFLTLQDFSDPELIRNYVSDAEDYRLICRLYESKPAESRLCLFNVTMQNHNPYTSDWISDNPVKFSDELRDQPVNQYLSLLRKSDDALREFIQYFRDVPEPTLIVLFGDHQPHLPDDFYYRVMNKLPVQFGTDDVMKEHMVPYLLWANYDIPEQVREQVSSLNYLSLLVLQTAELQMTDYQRFLLDLEKHVPSISANGYYDAQGNLGQVDYADPETAKWLEEYEIVQYYYLFDGKHRQDKYFTIS